MAPTKILVSAGESSGDLYAAGLVEALRRLRPDLQAFGCAGVRMQAAGVRAVVDARSLAVVGLAEVLSHLPRIWGEYRKLVAAIRDERPDLAILTDSPDFHLRLAPHLKRAGIPVVYLIAPQVWAWRPGRVRTLRRLVDRLLCIFPFEEEFFRARGVNATYIGHPLTRIARPSRTREEFFQKHRLPPERPLVALLPGSRAGEVSRHLPALLEAAARMQQERAMSLIWAAPAGFGAGWGAGFDFRERIAGSSIQMIEGETWDVIAYADLALAASGTVTVEAAILGTPMVTYYKVSGLSWLVGRPLVRVPFLSMVNLIAGAKAVPELMQNEMTGSSLAAEALQLLRDESRRNRMRKELAEVRSRLSAAGGADPLERAAGIVQQVLSGSN